MPAHSRKPPYRFLLVVSLILALLHTFVGLSLLTDLPIPAWGKALGVAWLVLSWVLIPTQFLSRFVKPPALADALGWAGSLMMGIFSTLLVLTVLRDILLGLGALVLPGGVESRSVLWSAAAVLSLTLLISLIGFFNARRRARVVDVDIPLPGLPAALEGFTIAQISDIHVGPTIKRDYLDAIVNAVNELQADLVAVTGDVVDGSVEHLAPHTAPLSRLSARYGAYFVSGNHEYYSGEAAWSAEFQRLGLIVLKNRHVVLEHGGASLVLAGVTDYTAHQFVPEERSDPVAALAGAPNNAGARVLLAHQPRSAPDAASAGFDLQLSGHTHGGQFWPWNHFVRLQQPYTAGLHRLDELWVYTSRGTGYWGPPNRFGAPSEITRLRLVGV